MARYIDADLLIEFLSDTRKRLPKESKDFITRDNMLLNFEQYVNLISTEEDVVKAVRCKDCKFWTKYDDSAQGRCYLLNIDPTGYWYCGNGKRKEYEE